MNKNRGEIVGSDLISVKICKIEITNVASYDLFCFSEF